MTTKVDRAVTEARQSIGFVDDEHVARVLGITVPTLHNRRSAGKAPPSCKVGVAHLTDIKELVVWIRRRRVAHEARA